MNKYFLRTVSSTEGKIRLAVVYNGDFSENSPVNVELYNGDTAYGGGEWPLVRWPVATVRPEWPP